MWRLLRTTLDEAVTTSLPSLIIARNGAPTRLLGEEVMSACNHGGSTADSWEVSAAVGVIPSVASDVLDTRPLRATVAVVVQSRRDEERVVPYLRVALNPEVEEAGYAGIAFGYLLTVVLVLCLFFREGMRGRE